MSWHAKPLRPHDAHGLHSRYTVNITTTTVYERVQSPLTVASDLVLPIVREREPGSTKNTDSHWLFITSPAHHTCLFVSSHQTQRLASASNVTPTTHRFHPHAVASTLPGQVDARLSAGGTVITRARILAPPVGLPAGLAANLDAIEPPNGRDALVAT